MKVLIVVDVQNDFCPGGSLAVADGVKIIPAINDHVRDFEKTGLVVYTRDWHSPHHVSFASNHSGDAKPFTTVETRQGTQMLWPDHCVQGTKGAELHSDLRVTSGPIFSKGFEPDREDYSAIYAGEYSPLARYLKGQEVTEASVCGIATDYCVKANVIDLVKLLKKENVTVLTDAIAGVAEDSTKKAVDEMLKLGVNISFKEIAV